MSGERILHVVGNSEFGGGGIVILDLVAAARTAGYDVSVLTTDPVFQGKLREAGVPYVDIDVIRRPIRPLWDLGGLARLTSYLRRHRYDIVHTHTSKGGVVGRWAARMAGIPVIVHTVHGFSFHERSPRPVKLVYGALERFAARACDLVVTVSEELRDVALAAGIGTPDRVVAIPNGVGTERVRTTRTRDETRTGLGLAAEDLVAVTPGRLSEQKGHAVLFEALGGLGEPPELTVLCPGEGPDREALEEQVARLGLGERVRFLGFRDDIGDLLGAADMVVLPSLWEGLSIALLEAMAAGRPIVTTAIPSNREVSREGACAVLVPPGDPAALRDAVLRLAADPEARRELGTEARLVFEKHYTREAMTGAYLDRYRALLAEKLPG